MDVEKIYKTNFIFFLLLHFFYSQVRPCRQNEEQIPKVDIMKYLEGNKINYGKLLTDEVLAVDRLLVETAKKHMDVAGNILFLFF